MKEVRNNYYTFTDPKLKKEYKVILLSDIHNNSSILGTIKLILQEMKPDLILIAGDIIDKNIPEDYNSLFYFLDGISSNYPTYMCLGNHDISINNAQKFKIDFFDSIINDTLCVVMKNPFETQYYDENFSISSINIPLEWYSFLGENRKYLETYLKSLNIRCNSDIFNLLMCHSPNGFIKNNNISFSEYLENINLILAGHNHGGLVPDKLQDEVFKNLGIVGPYYKFFLKNAYGYWTTGNTSLLISNGITKLSKSSFHSSQICKLNKVLISDIYTINMQPSEIHGLKLIKKEIIKK